MHTASIPYNDDLLLRFGKSPDDLELEFRLLLAVKLFEIGRVTLGQAAEVAGMPKLRFMDALGELKVPVINLDPDQVADELRGL
jgi:predicted HTH domain antitoxin